MGRKRHQPQAGGLQQASPPPATAPATTATARKAPPDATAEHRWPTVSICTLTRNRQAFLPLLQACVASQTYPHPLIEWVIVDDSDNGEAPFQPDPDLDVQVNHVVLPSPLILGHKRNVSHEHCRGEIIVYMDDDDYYPSQRVSHAVERLLETGRLVAGGTMLPIYFTDSGQAWLAGPYGPNHATANTFAFRRELLDQTRYDPAATHAEEKAFLKNYEIPMAQLDPAQTILCMGHSTNTFDKRRLIQAGNNPRMRKLADMPAEFIQPSRLAAYADTHRCRTDQNASPRRSTARTLTQSTVVPSSIPKKSLVAIQGAPVLSRDRVREAGEASGTDEITHHGRHQFYADFLSSFDRSQAILEIRFGKGNDNGMSFWKSLFPGSRIYLADREHEAESVGHTVYRCDQSSRKELERLAERLEGAGIGLIVDNGSHLPEHRLLTFNTLFPGLLSAAGIYLVEDIETSHCREGESRGYPARYGWKQRSIVSRFIKLADWANRDFLSVNERRELLGELIEDGFAAEALNRISWVGIARNRVIVKKDLPGDSEYLGHLYQRKD